jgi:phospholipid/cholesterol/gamma-HCH transport system substrate-binding protein
MGIRIFVSLPHLIAEKEVKMYKEIKIALLVLVALVVSIWGYKYIIGKNLLKKSNLYYVDYDNVNRINISTPVKYLGYQVGFVSKVTPNLEKGLIRLTLDLNEDMALPKGSTANILTETFMGGASIILTIPGGCSGDCLPSGSVIEGKNLGILGSMVDKDDLKTYIEVFREGISVLIDSLGQQMTSGEADNPAGKSIENLAKTIDHLELLTRQMNGIMSTSGKNINQSMAGLTAIIKNIEANNKDITDLIGNVAEISNQIKEGDAKKSMDAIQTTLTDLQRTLKLVDTTFSGINGILATVNAGEGSLGKLIKEDELVTGIQDLSKHLDSLLSDLQARPYRYIPLKSRKKTEKIDRQQTPN